MGMVLTVLRERIVFLDGDVDVSANGRRRVAVSLFFLWAVFGGSWGIDVIDVRVAFGGI